MRTLLSAAILGAGLLAQPAHAETVTYEYTGVISTISQGFEGSVWSVPSAQIREHTFAVGQAFSGLFSYSTDATPEGVWDKFEEYEGPGSVELAFANGLQRVHDRSTVLASVNNSWYSNDDVFRIFGNVVHDWIYVILQDASGTAFDSIALPSALQLDDFNQAKVDYVPGWLDYAGFNYTVSGTITSLTRVTPVPEPGMAWLLLGGLGVLGAHCLARRRSVS